MTRFWRSVVLVRKSAVSSEARGRQLGSGKDGGGGLLTLFCRFWLLALGRGHNCC